MRLRKYKRYSLHYKSTCDSKECMTNIECQKVKCGANQSKTKLKKNKSKHSLVKVIPRSVRLQLGVQKSRMWRKP